MTDETISEETTGTEPETIITEPSQDPLEVELQRENKKEGRSEAEKAAFSLKKNLERAKELGVDVDQVLGIKIEEKTIDKDAPLTVGMYEQMQREQGQKTSIQLAEGIQDEREKALVIQYLKTRIVPSGDAHDDLRFARLAVNSVKNGQLAEEMARSTSPKSFSSGAGAPAKSVAKEPELTAQEIQFTKPPFNMSVAEIIAARTN